MIRIIVTFIEIIICFLLQSAVFPHFALANVVPDIMIILIVANAYSRGIFSGMFTGLFCGLLVDCMYGSVIGLYGILYMVIGYLNGYSTKIYDREDVTIPMVLLAVSEFLYCFFYYVFEFLMRGRLNIGYYMFRIGLPSVIYTVLVGIILYKLFNFINIKLARLSNKEEA
ncbi:MAG: rod shape-determining protein MreD [Clostridiales bacterium]|nr:rod shape-determining protein MreD [Clostridiales bacterium]